MISAVVLALATISTISATSGDIRATLSFTMRPSGFSGEADYGPVVRDGKLTITKDGRIVAVIPLDRLGIRDAPTVFEIDPRQACGMVAPLSFVGSGARRYLVIESVWVGKGCRGVVHIVDLGSMQVVPEISIDHAYSHRLEVPAPERFFQKASLRVTEVSHVSVRVPPGMESQPWVLTIVRGKLGNGSGFAGFAEDLPATNAPAQGEVVQIGSLDSAASQPVIRFSPAHEKTWRAQKAPMSLRSERSILYNGYISYSLKLARQGKFDDALAAYKKALANLDDRDLYTRESADIPRLEKIIREVRSGDISLARAKKLWFGP